MDTLRRLTIHRETLRRLGATEMLAAAAVASQSHCNSICLLCPIPPRTKFC